MILLRRVIGDALRARRQGQHRTLREVSSAANVSLGYLSEIERGQKEASSELLAAICAALGAQLSELLREVGDTVALAEQMTGVLVPVTEQSVRAAGSAQTSAATSAATEPATSGTPAGAPSTATTPAAAPEPAMASAGAGLGSRRMTPTPSVHRVTTDGNVSVSVRQDSPLKATLRTTRRVRSAKSEPCAVVAA
ncbi:helix-turn-helix domain-containing protein [Micromonospora sp. NPDC003197]